MPSPSPSQWSAGVERPAGPARPAGRRLNMASGATCNTGEGLSAEDYALLAKSFKDEKFRQLLCDYAREVSDPDNRKQYEKEVIQYERERGVEAVFVHPSPGFALALVEGGGAPAFVNVCSSEAVQQPSVEAVAGGAEGCHKWSLPHAVTRPRQELVSGSGKPCAGHDSRQAVVYDVVFHPDALLLARQAPLVKQTLTNTALDALRRQFSVQTGTVQEAEQAYVGLPAQALIKRKMDKHCSSPSEQSSAYKDHRTNGTGDNESNKSVNKNKGASDKDGEFIEPVYKLKYVSKIDLQDYSLQLVPQCGPAWQPQALELEVSLPGVLRASQVEANVWEQSVLLTTESNPKYKLELPLRYPVDEDLSAAKFDVSTQKLTLTLTVVASSKGSDRLASQGQSPPSDSGIECELDYRTNGDSDNVSEVSSVSSQEDGAKEVMGEAVVEEEDSVFEAPQAENLLRLAPAYTVQQTRENLLVSLCCGNVIPSSIKVEQADDNRRAWIELSSVGGGQTTVHYSLKVDVSPNEIAAAGLSHRVEEGKVVLVLRKAVAGSWETCSVGHGDTLTPVTLAPLAAEKEEKQPKRETKTEEKQDDSKSCACMPRPPRVSRTVSMCETEAGHPFRLRGPTCSWPRGILKHRTRSLSESHVGAFSTSTALESGSSSLDIEVLEDKQRYGDDEEEGEESVEESIASSLGEKKSVRFNEVVSRQLFRSNSSILGQRAKNQRKAIRKRKSQARRDSESEKSDTGMTASESPSGESDLTTDAATDEDTDATTSNTGEGEDKDLADKDTKDIQNNNTRNANKDKLNAIGDILQSLTEGSDDNDVCQVTMTNNNNAGIVVLNNNLLKEDEEDNTDFIIKTSKKKKRKNKKNKLPSFEPTNTLIFELDMDK